MLNFCHRTTAIIDKMFQCWNVNNVSFLGGMLKTAKIVFTNCIAWRNTFKI